MKKLFFPLTLLVLVLFAVSCKWPKPEPVKAANYNAGLCQACLNAAPDASSMEIKIPDNGNQKALGEMAVWYDLTVDISRGLNFWILGWLSMVDEFLTYPPTQSNGNTCVWGPYIPDGLSPVEQRFSMTKHSDTDYEYLLDERPKNTQDDFTPVWGGHITPATDSVRRGIGTLYIDFTAAQALDPTWDVSGRIDVDYDTYTDGREININFTSFVSQDNLFPTDATYRYHNFTDNSGDFSFIYDADFPLEGVPDDHLETADQETLWQPTGEGYSTVTISGGDLTNLVIGGKTVDQIEGKECWDELFKRTFYRFQLVFDDNSTVDIDTQEGQESDCATF